MDNADEKGTAKRALHELGLPTVAGVVGAGAGLILTRTGTSAGVSAVKDGVGDLMNDLRQRLDSVTAKAGGDAREAAASTGRTSTSATLSPDEFADRRRARGKRREQRRRSGA